MPRIVAAPAATGPMTWDDSRGVDHEMRAWIKSLSARRLPSNDPDRYKLSDEAKAYLRRIATDGTRKAALHEIGASEPDLAC